MTAIFAYIFYFVAASASPLQRRWLALNRNVESRGQIHFAFLVALVTVVLSPILLFLDRFRISGNASTLILLSLSAGLSSAGYWIASYIAQKHVEAGLSTLVSNIYTPITIILAWIFLSEKLTVHQIVGTILLLVAIVLISKKHRIGTFRFDKYFLMMLFSGAVLGITLVSERALQKITGFSAGTMLSWWSQCLFLGLATLVTKSKSSYEKKDIVITGMLRFLQMLSWVILIFVVGNLSLVSAVTTFKVVVIFIAAALWLGEREDLGRKLLGSVIAVVGLLLMK